MSYPPTSDSLYHEAYIEDGKVFLSNNDDPYYEQCFESREQMQDFIDYLTRIADKAWPS